MQWGISFSVVSNFDKTLWSLPPPSATRWLTKMDNTKTLEVLYHFEYMPQSWKEWQRVASIKVQLKELIPQLLFNEYERADAVERVYTISELGKSFTKFIKYHKPLYPQGKSELMRSLTLYAMRLHYEDMLHFEAVLAMALHFNTRCKCDYSLREINKKARAVLNLDRSEWRVKLSKSELREAYDQRNKSIAEAKRNKSQSKRDEALLLREGGMLLKDIATKLKVSLITVKRWKLPK